MILSKVKSLIIISLLLVVFICMPLGMAHAYYGSGLGSSLYGLGGYGLGSSLYGGSLYGLGGLGGYGLGSSLYGGSLYGLGGLGGYGLGSSLYGGSLYGLGGLGGYGLGSSLYGSSLYGLGGLGGYGLGSSLYGGSLYGLGGLGSIYSSGSFTASPSNNGTAYYFGAPGTYGYSPLGLGTTNPLLSLGGLSLLGSSSITPAASLAVTAE